MHIVSENTFRFEPSNLDRTITRCRLHLTTPDHNPISIWRLHYILIFIWSSSKIKSLNFAIKW